MYNGVTKKHGEVARLICLPVSYAIDAITNGVHAATTGSAQRSSFQQLYDRYIPDWRRSNSSLRYALSIQNNERDLGRTPPGKTAL